jgi:hypothetical protein
MSSQTDFTYQIERAAGLTMDATCACHSAGILPLPPGHRRLLIAATRKLEGAQQDLFNARNNPWAPPPQPKNQQLALL